MRDWHPYAMRIFRGLVPKTGSQPRFFQGIEDCRMIGRNRAGLSEAHSWAESGLRLLAALKGGRIGD